MTVTTKQLTAKQVLDHMKARLAITQSNYLTSPTSFYWNILIQEMFAYQQMHYTVYGKHNDAAKDAERIMEQINSGSVESWADIVCRTKLGMSLRDALEEYGHCTW